MINKVKRFIIFVGNGVFLFFEGFKFFKEFFDKGRIFVIIIF